MQHMTIGKINMHAQTDMCENSLPCSYGRPVCLIHSFLTIVTRSAFLFTPSEDAYRAT